MLSVESCLHPFHLFLLNARMMVTLDSTGQDEIIALAEVLRERNIGFVPAGGGRFHAIGQRGGIAGAAGRQNLFDTVSAALHALGKGGAPIIAGESDD